ncbi:hypothetical protein PMNALOAF_1903 [Methylobacterium adhaesivum]|uniref:Autotransporter domain-containing protein n=1 Tax=Methylobacterium adhaesivum TaxID=333297 RepID=A0ABT8BCG8_9HYPH|nr:autotransporter domain-containing protein [Methylobacterium adhaesivum]MDN3589636.1 autotransporter domain-containing protein [Methylobacterium adhaesivum]GJD30653.1 hypothetical protein PMNALOAF_1903 [Methylobacterium adhaesivum]
MTCTDAQPTGFVAPAGVTGLTVNIQSGATLGSQQTSSGTNPSFTNVRVNGTSVVNNAGIIDNGAPQNRDNFGVNLAGDRSTLNNTGTITLTAPAGNTTTRIYGAYSSAPNGAQYESTTVNNSGTIAVTQNGNGIARGIYSGENTTLFTLNNTGLISATRGTSATASTAVVAGVDSDDDTDRLVVNNSASGRITATGANTRAISGRAAQYEINNSGTITNTTAGEAAIATFAVNAGNAGDATTQRAYNTVITNTATGVINGDVRNFDQDLQTAATVVNLRRTGTLTNAGTINGNVAFGGGSQTVNNTGRISGGLSFLDVAGTVNTVNLGTGSSIGGNITAQGLGTNTLNLSGNGTLTGTLTGFTGLNQTAAGSAWTTASGSVQTLSGNLTVAGGNLTLGAGSTQNVGGLIQVTGAGAQLTVNNTLTNKTVNLSGSNTSLVNNGTLTGTGAAGRANTSATRVYGVLTNSTGADFANVSVTNNGTIAVTENGIGISRGIYAGENIASMAITNSGTISATRSATSTGTAAVAAIDSDDDVAALTVTNRAGGTISGAGTGVRAIQGRAQSFTIVNDGAITGPAGGQAIVVYGAGTATLANNASGVITGDVRFTDADPQNATTANRRNSTTTNAGRIAGNIQYGMGSHTLTNTGAITGNITYADVAASQNTVNLGTGSSIGGNITATGQGTNTLNLSGTGTLTGTVTGFTSLNQTGAGSAWTTASGSVQNLSGNLTVAGGNLTLGAGSTQNVGGLIQVTGAGAQLTVNNTLTNKTVNLSGSNTSLVNNGTLTGTGAAGRANTSATRVYGVLTNSTGADFANVSVTNNGIIAVTENGIGISRGIYAGENIASMAITNAGTISATRNGTGTAAVAAIDSDDDVAALTVTNRAGGTISGTGTGVRAIQGRAQSFTIVNDGAITGPAGGQAIVVYGAGTATLTNNASGVITGDVRFTDADPQNTTTANRRNSTTTNAGRIAGNIQYGMGSHTLTNTGAITGNIAFADVAASRNTVTLGTGSTIGGTITATGLGINALNLTGTGTLASTVTGFTTLREADGAWTLASGSTQTFSGGATVVGGALTVNSTLNANTTVGTAGTLAGTGRVVGTLTNAGIVAPGSAAAPTGTLTVAGNYVQGASGTLQSAVTADGQAARLVTTGTATLGGTASLIAAAGTYLPNTRYTVLTAAGGVNGTFATVTDSGTLPFLIRPVASTDANNAYVTLAQQSFGLVAQTGNQANVARGLDAALANNPQALLVIDNQSNAGIAATLDRISGQSYASLADPQLRSGRAFGSQLLSRAYAASTEAGPTGFTLPPTVYAADMPNRAAPSAPRFIETSRGYGVWATGYGQFGRVDSTANAAGRSETVAGMAGGIDFHPQVGTVLGIAAGYGSVDVGLNRTGERAHTDNAQVGLYGGFNSGALYANATVGYAHTEGRVNRSLGLAQIQSGGAQGKVSGDQFISAGELGYRFALAPTTVLSPFVGFQVNTFAQDRVTEGSAGPLSLTIAAKDFLSARTLVGGRLETATTVFDGRPVSFWVKAAYVHDFADVSRTIGASFTLVPTVPFAVSGRRLDRDRALVGLGVSTELAPGLAGFLGYDAELASTDTIQAVRGGFRYTF